MTVRLDSPHRKQTVRRALRESIPFVTALLIGTLAGAIVAAWRYSPLIPKNLPEGLPEGCLKRPPRNAGVSASLAPRGRGYQAFERVVVQPHRIALAFHSKPQDATRQLVRLHGRVADRFE